MIDVWDCSTFPTELRELLESNSELILGYYREDAHGMAQILDNTPLHEIENNSFSDDFVYFRNETLLSVVKDISIRAWHYTRLTDQEVLSISKQLVPASPDCLRQRLDDVVASSLLGVSEANLVFQQSVLLYKHQQGRIGYFWLTTAPISPSETGVAPLLSSWGGESAYWYLEDEGVLAKLRDIGLPRIIEVRTSVTDKTNAFTVAMSCLDAWVSRAGLEVKVGPKDLPISGAILDAAVIHVHTEGDALFNSIGKTYPSSFNTLLSHT